MKTAFIFSGQGSQYPGMMKELCEKYEACKNILKIASEVVGRDIEQLIMQGTQEELNLTINTQICVLAADLIAYKALREEGYAPDVVAGFSLGEYAALCVAGVLSERDAFRVVKVRAAAMQEAAPFGLGTMVAVMNKTAEEVEQFCQMVDGYVIPVNYNCPGQVVVSGEICAIENLLEVLKEQRVRATKLAVSAPFHCKYMEAAAEKLRVLFDQVAFSQPMLPIFLNCDAKEETEPTQIKKKMVKQVKSPVYWETTLRNMEEKGVDLFIELGPGKTLTSFVRRTLPEVERGHVEDIDSLIETLKMLKERG